MKSFLQSISKKWKKFLERMAKENNEQYGSGRVDCCNLNKEPGPKRYPKR